MLKTTVNVALIGSALLAQTALTVGIETLAQPAAVSDFSLETSPLFDSVPTGTVLAQKSSSSRYSKSTGKADSDPWGIGRFLAGCVLIPFALVLLWKNEKKVVTFAKCMDQGREQVRTVDCEDPDEQNEFELVHLTGTSVNAVEIIDNDFGVVAPNSYRLKRKVEMYQWREVRRDHGDRAEFTYETVWSETKIESGSFHDHAQHTNPSHTWPFASRTFEATNVTLGKFHLRPEQVLRLGRGQTQKVTLEAEGGQAVKSSTAGMQQAGFAPFEMRGIYLVSSTHNNAEQGPHVGQYRVTFEYDMCGPATIIAQQVQNEEGQHTFRKWNPEKIRVPYGQSTNADSSATGGSLMCCYICMLIDKGCEMAFEEVVDCAVDTKQTSTEYFDDQKKNIKTASMIIRPLGIVLTDLGLYLLFSPIIALLTWIPLVGWLLGGVVAIAAIVFSLVVGTVVSLLVIALAWLVYRPLIGCLLLASVAIGVYFIFFFPAESAVADVDTSTAVAAQISSTMLAQLQAIGQSYLA